MKKLPDVTVAILYLEGGDGEIECLSAATSKEEALGKMYDRLKNRGLIKEVESGWGEYVKGDRGYREISRETFIKSPHRVADRMGGYLSIKKG